MAYELFGVSGDVIEDWFLAAQPENLVYVPYSQSVPASVGFVVRTKGDPLALATPVRKQLQSLDPAVPLLDLNSMERAMAEERAGVRAAAGAMSTYAAIALLLAITGYLRRRFVFGIHAHSRYPGIHLALGATRTDVLKLATRQTGKLIIFGVAGGLLLSIVLTRVMAHVLLDVVQLDAPVWFVLTSILMGAALLAAYLPALRATKIDPLNALRHE